MTTPLLRLHDWSRLDREARHDLLRRPAQRDQEELMASARRIVEHVRQQGDAALIELTERHDHVHLTAIAVTEAEFTEAATALTPNEKRAIERAIGTVRAFHAAQRLPPLSVETVPGVLCERIEVPLASVGMYVPAGTAPLPSTAIMIGVPAEIAGCGVRVMCTPPRRDGRADPAVLYTARACGVTHVFKVGGAQAIAAMAYGTATVPKVDKIFGPGNAWVTAAKLLVSMDPEGAAYDMPAGPSEVLVIADESAHAEFVAADLLAQAEHSVDAQVILVTTDREVAHGVQRELEHQLERLARGEIIRAALASSRAILVDTLETAFEVSNQYAPEHLIIQVERARSWLPRVRHAGSVFLGALSPESMGDYCSGTNHVLPTYGYARAFSGLSLADFSRRITVQELTEEGIRDLGPVAQTLALMEGLDAHANAVTVRLARLAKGQS
ncbi:MAG: histidinol dehydrogenase [Gammaproteobacteria bacterium]|nr:histidinol dehydrogenase [Gammaproteobacteria bacterium]